MIGEPGSRNGIERGCDFGRKQVRDMRIVERYGHVIHTVSSVEEKLSAGQTPYALQHTTFPTHSP